MRRVSKIATISSAVIVLALLAFSLYFSSLTSPVQKESVLGFRSPCYYDEGGNPPYMKPFSTFGILSLEQAQQRATNYDIRLPSNESLPKGFSLRGVVFYGANSLLLYWDKELPSNAAEDNFYEAGGIIIKAMYWPGGNPLFPKPNPEIEWSDVGWYPRQKFAEIINFKENVAFKVDGCYQEELLLGIAESIRIGGGL